jgi:hypothetical protein
MQRELASHECVGVVVLRMSLDGISLWGRVVGDDPCPSSYCATWDRRMSGKSCPVVPESGSLWWRRAVMAVNVCRSDHGYTIGKNGAYHGSVCQRAAR